MNQNRVREMLFTKHLGKIPQHCGQYVVDKQQLYGKRNTHTLTSIKLPSSPSHPFKTARCPYHAEPTNATYISKMQFWLPRACNHITSRKREKGNRSSMRCNGLHSSSRHIQTRNPRPSGVGIASISGSPCQQFSIHPITTLRVPQR